MKSAVRYVLALLFVLLAQGLGAQNLGVPFFDNIPAHQYNGHNRNMDVVCDSTGRVYVANFEGLLVYDGVSWSMHHTPGISRVTSLFVASDGKVWFGGNNVLGYVSSNDTLSVHFISDEKHDVHFGEVLQIREDKGTICFSTNTDQDFKVDHGRLHPLKAPLPQQNDKKTLFGLEYVEKVEIPERGLTAVATSNQGVLILDRQGNIVYSLNTDNGLCSNSITSLAYDGKGSVWGTSDNGIFRFNTMFIYTRFSTHEGLLGQVTAIQQVKNDLYVGTLMGVYKLVGKRFVRLPVTDQACWQLSVTPENHLLAATADGVFVLNNDVPQCLAKRHTLAVYVGENRSFLTGEVDGIYRYTYGQEDKMLDKIPNVVRFESDGKGGVWALTLYSETYYLAPGAEHFVKKSNPNLSLLLNYRDAQGRTWTSQNNGKGLQCDDIAADQRIWLKPFDAYTVQTMMVRDGVVWIGGTYGLVRFDMEAAKQTSFWTPRLYIRHFSLDNRHAHVCMANDMADLLGNVTYSFRLHDDDAWSSWRTSNQLDFDNLSYGKYQLTMRSRDVFGIEATSRTITFEIPYPIYLRWYSVLLYLVALGLVFFGIARLRMRQLVKEQERLERIVNERTQELKDAQQQLIRQEREATVGKLTKGLIDRILNPMNYINNFSHLSLGLTKDLRENLEDIDDNVNSGDDIDKEELQDTFDDCQDVLDMMKQNLEKIEQHGLSTTRILKAMEEMLKERTGTRSSTDLNALCQQNYEMLNKYFADDIARLHITVEWHKHPEPVMVDITPELISKTVMSMLSNSVYAVRKKCEKAVAGYQPVIRLTLEQQSGVTLIKLYDNGIGIEEGILDKVFDPFFTTKPTSEAPGVGLYLSQQIMQDHGGSITVQSTKDEYTEFALRF